MGEEGGRQGGRDPHRVRDRDAAATAGRTAASLQIGSCHAHRRPCSTHREAGGARADAQQRARTQGFKCRSGSRRSRSEPAASCPRPSSVLGPRAPVSHICALFCIMRIQRRPQLRLTRRSCSERTGEDGRLGSRSSSGLRKEVLVSRPSPRVLTAAADVQLLAAHDDDMLAAGARREGAGEKTRKGQRPRALTGRSDEGGGRRSSS